MPILCSPPTKRGGRERECAKQQKLWGVEYRCGRAGGPARSSDEAFVMNVERRGWLIRGFVHANNRTWSGRTRVGKSDPKDKSFDISKRLVWEAYKSVKANKGAAGVDGQSIEDFEADQE